MRWPWSKKPGASAPKTDDPQCGEAMHHTVGNEPHTVGAQPEPSPQCGETKLTKLQRGENALRALEQTWRQQAEAPPSSESARHLDDAKKLAGEFRRQIQAQRDLLGLALSSTRWVRPNYHLFCQSLGINWQTKPYKDFARELAHLMPRKRREEWHAGKRLGTATFYGVPDPDEAVVALSNEMRKRA